MVRPTGARAVLVLVIAGCLAAPSLASAQRLDAHVEVANVGPVVEAQRVSSVPDDGSWLVWVWISDANGPQDLVAVELVDGPERLDVAREPSWTSREIARYAIEVPSGSLASGDTRIVVTDQAGASASEPLDAPSDRERAVAAGSIGDGVREASGPGPWILVALSLAAILLGRRR